MNLSIVRPGSLLPDGNTSSPQRPNVVSGQSVIPANQGIANFINAAAFAIPTPGTFGDAGRNLLRGPDQWQLDSALLKNIPLTEHLRLDIRGRGIQHLQPSSIWIAERQLF